MSATKRAPCDRADCAHQRQLLARAVPLSEVDVICDALATWKAVAVALHSRLANEVCDPYDPAVLAYNHARNGRRDEARAYAQEAIA